MTNQTAITPYNRIRDVMRRPEIQEKFQEVLGKKANGFMASVLNTVYTNDKLQECDPNSIVISAMKAAVLDLPVDPNLGFSYIIPYKNRGNSEAQFQIGYRGLIQLALRSREYESLNAGAVYEGEEVRIDRLSGRIIINGKRAGNEVIGYFGYFKLLNGFEKFAYMTTDELWMHAQRYSKSLQFAMSKKIDDYSPWQTNLADMCKKTLIKQVLKYGPLSIDLKQALTEDDEELPIDNRLSNMPDLSQPDYIEGEVKEVASEGAMDTDQDMTPEQVAIYQEWLVLGATEKKARTNAEKGIRP